MDFDELLGFRPRVEGLLRGQFARERRRFGERFSPFVAALEEFTLRGGKRFRALLLLAGYHLASRGIPSPALPAAAALEHFQSWMLIHDDIIDHAETRWGGPTVHRSLAEEHRSHSRIGNSSDYGVGVGITLGDLEVPFTLGSLSEIRLAPSRKLRALSEFIEMTRLTALGQLLDIRNGSVPPSEVSEEDVLLVHRLKSAEYTVAGPLAIGAILGGGREGLVKDLRTFGVDSGVAFQLRDDVLGAGFDSAASGKSANDLVEGKRTLLVVRAWTEADSVGRQKLAAVLGNSSATSEQVEDARSVIKSTGSLAYSETQITRLTERALGRVRRSRNFSAAGRELLGEIADRLSQRSV